MLQLFRRNQPSALVFLVLYAVLLHLSAFIFPSEVVMYQNPQNYLWEGFYQLLQPYPTFIKALTTALILGQAIFLNEIINRYKMTDLPTYIIGMTYVLLASALPEFLQLHPLHLVNLCLLISLSELFRGYRQVSAAATLFNAGFFIGVASLFYGTILLFLPLLFIGLSIIRAIDLKELLILTFGFGTPFFLFWTYLFWYDQTIMFWAFLDNFAVLNFEILSDTTTYLKAGLFLLLIFLSILNIQNFYYRTTIQVQKYLGLFFWALAFSGISLVFQKNLLMNHLLLTVIPLTVFTGFLFNNAKNKGVAGFFHFILLLFVLFLQYKAPITEILTFK